MYSGEESPGVTTAKNVLSMPTSISPAVSNKVFANFYELPISASAGSIASDSNIVADSSATFMLAGTRPAKRQRTRQMPAIQDSSGLYLTDRQREGVPEID
eukprot:SAG31_NODE_228_length_19803_cov_29.496498_9_plen_101_part_00